MPKVRAPAPQWESAGKDCLASYNSTSCEGFGGVWGNPKILFKTFPLRAERLGEQSRPEGKGEHQHQLLLCSRRQAQRVSPAGPPTAGGRLSFGSQWDSEQARHPLPIWDGGRRREADQEGAASSSGCGAGSHPARRATLLPL